MREVDIMLDVSESIPFLDIEQESYHLQRLFFHKICKVFYRPQYSLDDMNLNNFDWFRPQNRHRHTLEEVLCFCSQSGLLVDHSEVGGSDILASTTLSSEPHKT